MREVVGSNPTTLTKLNKEVIMNQQQKKYAISRIYTILLDKCQNVEKQEYEIIKEVDKRREYTNSKILEMFRNNEIPIKSTVNVPNGKVGEYVYLKDFFDMSFLEKRVQKVNKNVGILKETNVININHPINKEQKTFYFYLQVSVDKINKAKKLLTEVCDKIVLGTDEEALAAIALVESVDI